MRMVTRSIENSMRAIEKFPHANPFPKEFFTISSRVFSYAAKEHGSSRDPGARLLLPHPQGIVHSVDDSGDRTVVSGTDAAFVVEGR